VRGEVADAVFVGVAIAEDEEVGEGEIFGENWDGEDGQN